MLQFTSFRNEGIWDTSSVEHSTVTPIGSSYPCFILRNSLIYEYVGDLVSQPSFLKRIRQCKGKGIRHFHSTMLQKER